MQSAQTDVGAQAEITENSLSRKLSVIERAELLDRWVKLREIRKEADAIQEAADHAFGSAEKLAQVAPVSKGGRNKEGGIRQAARDLGLPRDAVARAVKIAALSPEAKGAAKAKGVEDNQKALLAAAKEPTP